MLRYLTFDFEGVAEEDWETVWSIIQDAVDLFKPIPNIRLLIRNDEDFGEGWSPGSDHE